MDKRQATDMYSGLTEELDKLRKKIADLTRRESGLVKVIDGIQELFPDLDVTEVSRNETDPLLPERRANTVQPKGQEAVRRVLEAAAPRWLTVEEITDEIERRGWTPDSEEPIGAIRSATVRLMRNKGVTRRKRGRSYAYRTPYNDDKDSEALSID